MMYYNATLVKLRARQPVLEEEVHTYAEIHSIARTIKKVAKQIQEHETWQYQSSNMMRVTTNKSSMHN